MPTFEAVQSSSGFTAASVGYAGTASDGQSMLDADHALSRTYTDAPNGHVALTAGLALPRRGPVILALGFGMTQAAAIRTANWAAKTRFNRARASYERQWWRYDESLNRPSHQLSAAARQQYYRSVNVVKASEDKTFPGAIAAGLASPWGQSVPAGNATNGQPTYFGSYREVFARDLYEAFAGLLVAGGIRTARAATRFLLLRQQQPDGSMPRNSLLNGMVAPDTGGLQLDETSYLWPVLGGERGEYDVAAHNRAGAGQFLSAMAGMTSGGYLEPEQAWEDPAVAPSPFDSDPATASIGFSPGHPAGSASPLTWAQSQYARLALAIGAGRDLETPQVVKARYVTHGMPGTLPITIGSPADGSNVTGSTVNVSGTTTAGARVDVEAAPPTGGAVPIGWVIADGSGNWSLSLPVSFGTTKITATATKRNSTGYAQVSVINVTLPGDSELKLTDPNGDDNGPGTYAYPTSGSFQPGAFDITGFRVTQTTSDVYIQTQIKNLAATFGNSFGAQLLDVYVRNPHASAFSTAAAFPQRNYTIVSTDAWSQRIEVQGFHSPVWVDANGKAVGSLQFVVDDPSGTATLILPTKAFGSVGSGWTFTVALTGQDGFSGDQARSFAPTPLAFEFGVCAPGGTSPICAVDPNTVPKVLDTIPPSTTTQAAELDPTTHPSVMIHGVSVP